MDFDLVNEQDSYAQFLQEARWEILHGADAETDWEHIQTRHPFFVDVMRDAEGQARVLASVLAAAEFFLKELLWACEGGGAPAPAQAAEEVKILRAALLVFLTLYAASPVPTRARWVAEVQLRGGEMNVNDILDNKNNSNNNEDEEDDGSFVESRLRELVSRCVTIGRAWCRQLRGDGNDELITKVRSSIAIMDAFARPKTLDW